MKVVLLAGGFGSRISEESIFRPKPMIEIGGMPILWHIMKEYAAYGHTEFIICAGYKQEYIKQWFANYFLQTSDVTFDYTHGKNEITIHQNHAEPWKVTVVDTGLNTMTGGRIKRIQKYVGDEPFFMTYGDGVCDVDINKLLEFHKIHGKKATLTAVKLKQDKGILNIGGDNAVKSFREKNIGDGAPINAGYMVLEPSVFDLIKGDETVFEREPLEILVEQGELMSFVHEGFWQCMDNIREKEMLEKLWASGKAPWVANTPPENNETIRIKSSVIMTRKEELKQQILDLTREYYHEAHEVKLEFEEGKTFVNYGGRYYDDEEMVNLVDSSLDFWLTAGPWAHKFETRLAKWLGVKYCAVTNSGSSANLLAFYALTSPKLGDRAIKRGDEVITVAAGFPTTVNPIIQFGAVPVFVDVKTSTFDIDETQLEAAYSPKVKAVMLAHSLGNPFNLKAVKSFCEKHNLWLIEDNCDALGSEYTIDGVTKKTGTWGHIGTSSFYPPHHMTMGEGGAVYTDDPLLDKIVRSFRDWGRDCWCVGGVDNTCKMRFTGKFGELPEGYDHKYVYSHFGFNLKITDMQAAIGCAQLEKLDRIVEARRKNWQTLYDGLKDLPQLMMPEPEEGSNPSWFGFLIAVRPEAGFTRNELTGFLESRKIQTRNLFAGNLLRHPAFDEMRKSGEGYRVVGELKNTDFVMNNGFWIGVYPGMKPEMLNWMIKSIREFCKK